MKKDNLNDLLLKEMVIIHKYLRKIGVAKEDAEDIVQDAICKAIEFIDVLQEGKVRAWLFKVSLNSYYNLYRKRKHYPIIQDEQAILNLYTDNLVENNVINAELRSDVNEILAELREGYRTLIIMKYFMDMSYIEIGDTLGFSENKVKTYLYRARNKFKQLWEEKHHEKKQK